MDLAILRAELQNDPLARNYAGMSDQAAADSLNAADRPTQRDTVASHEIFEAIAPAEWAALTAQEKQRVQTILGMGTVNLRGTNTRASLAAAFGAGTATRTALQALQAGPPQSRAAELGIGRVGDGHVHSARS